MWMVNSYFLLRAKQSFIQVMIKLQTIVYAQYGCQLQVRRAQNAAW